MLIYFPECTKQTVFKCVLNGSQGSSYLDRLSMKFYPHINRDKLHNVTKFTVKVCMFILK